MVRMMGPRLDAWMNRTTNLGVKGKDKNVDSEVVYEPMEQTQAENLFATDPIAAKMVTLIALDMVRMGFKLSIPGMTEEELQPVMRYFDKTMKWKKYFYDALYQARLYGGSALMPVTGDKADALKEPLNEKNLRGVKPGIVFNRWELQEQGMQDDITKEGYGMPAKYLIQPSGVGSSNFSDVPDTSAKRGKDGKPTYSPRGNPSQTSMRLNSTLCDASRLIRFDGETLPRQLFIDNGYWNDSILNKRYEQIRDYSMGHTAASALVSDFAQAIFKVLDFDEIVAGDDGEALMQARLDIVEYFRSVLNAVVVGKDEDFERKSTNVTGLPELLDRLANRLVAASEYPHNILLGEAPGASLGEAGQAQMRVYYDIVASYQETRLREPLERFIGLVFLDKEGPTNGVVPKDWELEFCPLYQEPQSVQLANKKIQAETDAIYIDKQVLAAEEVAESRFGSGQYSFDTKLEYDREFNRESPEQTKPEENPDDDKKETGEGDEGDKGGEGE